VMSLLTVNTLQTFSCIEQNSNCRLAALSEPARHYHLT